MCIAAESNTTSGIGYHNWEVPKHLYAYVRLSRAPHHTLPPFIRDIGAARDARLFAKFVFVFGYAVHTHLLMYVFYVCVLLYKSFAKAPLAYIRKTCDLRVETMTVGVTKQAAKNTHTTV